LTTGNRTSARLGDFIRVKHGYAFKGQFFSDSGSHIVLTPGNFFDAGGFRTRGEKDKRYVGPIPSEYVLQRGDLIVVMTEQAEGLLGSAAIVPEDNLYLHNQRLGLVEELRPGTVDPRFLYYLFNSTSVRKQIRATANGAKVRHTSPGRICDVEISLPPVQVQRKIASILSAYDDLIENNLRRIKLLEEMAQSLYKEWFVDFRFPGHENVRMVDSPLGMIPEGWETRRVGDLATISRGRSYSSENLVEAGGLPFVNLKCIDRDGGFRRGGLKWFSGPVKEQHVVRRGDIVMAVTDMTQERRIVARAARVPDVGEAGGVMSMDLVKLVPCQVPGSYLYYLLRCSRFPDEVKNHATGVNVLHLNPDRIADFEVPIPSADLMEVFSAIADDALSQQETLETQSGCLRQTRDLLLPKLISGEIDVSDLDIDIGEDAA